MIWESKEGEENVSFQMGRPEPPDEILSDSRFTGPSSMEDSMVAQSAGSKPNIFMFKREHYQGSSVQFILIHH